MRGPCMIENCRIIEELSLLAFGSFTNHNQEMDVRKLYGFLENLKRDERAQDMVEYALLAGFIAVAAGALLPGIADGISTIFSKMASLINNAAAQ